MTITLTNRDARWLWLERQGLADTPTGPADHEAVAAIIERLGFIQLDTIRIVARAHDHILWARRQNYREAMLDDLMKRRMVFEHFTHDASVIPTVFYPNWRRQFERMKASVETSGWYDMMPSKKDCEKILKRIADEGALSTRDFEAQKSKSKHAWARPPHKFALDYFWYAGVLATCHRRNFIKHYDLAERVIPAKQHKKKISDTRQVDWLCTNALERLGFASEGDIQRFWDAVDLGEVKAWTKKRRKNIVDVEVKCADGAIYKASAFEDIEDRLQQLKAPTSRLRILNPFDPVIRDRNRLKRLFGFDYRVEMFTPAAKRQYGYYVYPMLEGDRFVGRIEAKANRKAGKITVENIWWEPGVQITDARLRKLDAELERMRRFIGVREVVWR
ncbi:MAG: winged helix-turn-helix domain-containing protein [Alphaproteobacteria bacterium]|nr:winged helix-turn-helix domain-containing protein [Alphaproteobacteria bacterium]